MFFLLCFLSSSFELAETSMSGWGAFWLVLRRLLVVLRRLLELIRVLLRFLLLLLVFFFLLSFSVVVWLLNDGSGVP